MYNSRLRNLHHSPLPDSWLQVAEYVLYVTCATFAVGPRRLALNPTLRFRPFHASRPENQFSVTKNNVIRLRINRPPWLQSHSDNTRIEFLGIGLVTPVKNHPQETCFTSSMKVRQHFQTLSEKSDDPDPWGPTGTHFAAPKHYLQPWFGPSVTPRHSDSAIANRICVTRRKRQIFHQFSLEETIECERETSETNANRRFRT